MVLLINASPRRNGATHAILDEIAHVLGNSCTQLRLSDYEIGYCRGCKHCYKTARCVQSDGMDAILQCMEAADSIVIASPSYWGDMTGQLKVFIDRCTPYCNTHQPHACLSEGKRGYAVALRTGEKPGECPHIIASMQHFYGHMGIEFDPRSGLYFCGIEEAGDIVRHHDEIRQFAGGIL